jgi:Tripartite tricarboxylate transporter family receptor
VTTAARAPPLPDVLTIREVLALSTIEAGTWQGLMMPTGIAPAIVAKLTIAPHCTLKDGATRNLLIDQGSVILGGTAKDHAAFMQTEGGPRRVSSRV